MPISLDRLPFDIFFHIASSLEFDDTINLSQTCRQLRLLLDESTLCRKTLEAHAPHSREARLAQDGTITYSQAIDRIQDRRCAFSNAYPFSARIIGQGTAFSYRQGVLCVLQDSMVRTTNIHASSEVSEFDLHSVIIPESCSPPGPPAAEAKVSLLYYSDSIVAVLYESRVRPSNGRILAVRTAANILSEKRLIISIPLTSSSKLFVRHTDSFLYYGTYSGEGSDGHHEWQVQGVSLVSKDTSPKRFPPLQLEEFYGTDIGSTITFEIHGGYFYALSNQTSFDVEELDWTSFYHCIRFPLELPIPGAMQINQRIYRRQHAEGPIHDSWTDLTIQFDECTNKPMIVESRREWQQGSSRQLRTFYVSDITFPTDTDTTPLEDEAGNVIGATHDATGPLLPPDDPFSDLVDSTNNPHYAPTQPRFNWNFHPEFGLQGPNPRSFMLARTKYRAYNYSCASFIDLVEDDRCCGGMGPDGLCLRIRVGSRRAAPRHWHAGSKPESSTGKAVSPTVVDSKDDQQYRHSSIKMWPPPASSCPCAKRLHSILNPRVTSGSGHGKGITGIVDERSLVYMVRNARSYGGDNNALGTIVLVSFDRTLQDPAICARALSEKKKLDDELEDHFSPTEWRWTSDHPALCQKGACR